MSTETTAGKYWHEHHDCDREHCAWPDSRGVYPCGWSFEKQRHDDEARHSTPAHLWPCGCLRNDAGAHRAGCPDHPEGVRG